MATGQTIAVTIWTFVAKVMSLIFNILSSFAITFLSRNKCLLILWKQSLSVVILKFKKRKSVIISTCPLSICHEVMGLDAKILICIFFLILCFLLTFSLSSSTFIKRFFNPSIWSRNHTSLYISSSKGCMHPNVYWSNFCNIQDMG